MNRIFKPRGFFNMPDGTDVSPFLNSTDSSQNDVPWGILDQMSIAVGRIGQNVSSWIHVHHIVTQVTYLLSGNINIYTKDRAFRTPYRLLMKPHQAVVTLPGTLFQLQNNHRKIAEVLYIVSPSYVFEMDGDEVIYDDATIVAET